MFTGDLAKHRMEDRVREAQAYRATRALREARAAERRGRVRRIAHGALAAIVWPVKH